MLQRSMWSDISTITYNIGISARLIEVGEDHVFELESAVVSQMPQAVQCRTGLYGPIYSYN